MPYKLCVDLFNEVIFLDDLDYQEEETAQKLQDVLVKDKPMLFSLESLIGAPFIYNGLNRSNAAKRLQKLGINKVIITIRRQEAMIDSLYRQYICQGGVMRFKDFLNADNKWGLYIRSFNPAYLKYDRIVSLYLEVFGRENVLVMPHEMLKKSKEDYLKKVQTFLNDSFVELPEVTVNRSLTNFSTGLLRILNHFTFSSEKPNNLIWNKISTMNFRKLFQVILDPYLISTFSGRSSYLKESDLLYINQYYSASNKKLSAMLDQDLKSLGYSVD